jgi:ABC-2 type transport system permease protein
MTRVNGFDVTVGITISQLILVVIQILICFGTALLFGFKSSGSISLAIGIGLLLNLAATGCGLITACFTHNDGEAANLGTAFMVPLVFLSGALFPLPPMILGKVAGQEISLIDIMPSTHAVEAMRRVLVFGDGIASIGYHLGMVTILSLGLLIIGALLFQRTRFEKS